MCCSPWSCKESYTTEWLNWTEWPVILSVFSCNYLQFLCLLGEVSVKNFGLFFHQIDEFSDYWWVCRAAYSRYRSILVYVFCWYFLLFGLIQSCPTVFAPWTVAPCQAPLSMEFSRQECCSGLPFATPGDHPDPGLETMSLQLCIGRWILYH